MTTKSKTKKAVTAKKMPTWKTPPSDSAALDKMLTRAVEVIRDATTSKIDKRKELLARVAGDIAAGLVTTPTSRPSWLRPTESIASPRGIATSAVIIAEEILTLAGISSTDAAAETSSSGDVDVGAAS